MESARAIVVDYAGSGASAVLQSLNSNARDAFQIVVDHQLKNPSSRGLPFGEWYDTCRRKYLLSSETSLRHHAGELRDHKLLIIRRIGSNEVVAVPGGSDALRLLERELDSLKA